MNKEYEQFEKWFHDTQIENSLFPNVMKLFETSKAILWEAYHAGVVNNENLKIAELEAENKKLGDYYMKINDMYWNDEIFEVNHGEGFYTDKFVDMVVDL